MLLLYLIIMECLVQVVSILCVCSVDFHVIFPFISGADQFLHRSDHFSSRVRRLAKFSVINCLLTPRSSEPSSTASFLCTAFFNVHSAITSKQHQHSTSTINMFVALKCAKAVGTTFGTFCVADILSNFILHPSQKVSTCSYCRCSGMKNPLEQTNQGTIRH